MDCRVHLLQFSVCHFKFTEIISNYRNISNWITQHFTEMISVFSKFLYFFCSFCLMGALDFLVLSMHFTSFDTCSPSIPSTLYSPFFCLLCALYFPSFCIPGALDFPSFVYASETATNLRWPHQQFTGPSIFLARLFGSQQIFVTEIHQSKKQPDHLNSQIEFPYEAQERIVVYSQRWPCLTHNRTWRS